MPRRRENDQGSDESDSEYSTDSDCEYALSAEEAYAIMQGVSGVTEKGIKDAYVKQRGICRITGMPFDAGMYAPTVAQRSFSIPLSDANMVIVVGIVERMRGSTGLPWRSFVRILQTFGKDADM